MKKRTMLATLFLCLAATGASAQMTNQGAVMPEAPNASASSHRLALSG